MYKLILFLISGALIAQDDGLKSYQSGDFDNARKYYESILDEREENASAQFGLGTTAFQQQDFMSALNAFKKAMETNDNELKSKTYYNMANTLASLQKNDEALALYRKTLELNPDDHDAKHNYEMLRYQQKEDQDKDKGSEEQQAKEEDKDSDIEKQENRNREQKEQEQEKERQQQGQEKQEPQELEKEDREKQQDLEHAQSILDALKKDEKVNQKRQMSRARSKKLEKDW